MDEIFVSDFWLSNAAEAWALAQFAKRIGWTELRANAVDDAEAYLMRDSIEELSTALAKAGFTPR